MTVSLAPAPAPDQTASPLVERVSTGGVTAWLVRQPGLPLMVLDFAFRGGASQDPPGKAGAANLIAGMMDEGAGDLDAEAFQARLADRAIELSFSADRDDLRGSLRTLTRHRDEAVDLLAMALQAPRFDADALARVQGQVSAGLRRELQDPDAQARVAFAAAAFPGHPYGLAARGSLDSVAAIAPGDLHALAKRLFTRDGLHLVAVGDLSADDLVAIIERVFLPLADTGGFVEVPRVGLAHGGEVRIVPMDVPQTALRYGGQGLMRDDPDFIAAEIVNHILGGSAFTSRLFMEVREKRGLAYGVSSSLLPLRAASLHVGGTATKNDRVAESLEVMRAEMAQLGRDGPTEAELADAKSYLIGSFPLRFDTSGKIASQLLSFSLAGLGIDYIARRNALFAAVTLEDARRAARRLYGDGQLLVVAVGQPQGLA
jgi:zinc protease